MNLTCPECSTVYRIDPARVPAGGVAARCRECDTVFRVEADGPHPPGQVRRAVAVGTATSSDASLAAGPPAGGSAAAGAESEPRESVGSAGSAGSDESPSGAGPEAGGMAAAKPPASPAFGPQDPQTRARRLARALVSDIKVYNPDKWEESQRAGTLRKQFRDEILKSWDEYVEQVGEDMAKRTPYFRAALNEILAGGESVF